MIRGLIEGFYDRLWTPDERERVAEYVAGRGFDTYVYAPKMDRSQNEAWRTPYTDEQRRQLAALGDRCRSLGMSYWIGMRPLGFAYGDPGEATLLEEKLRDHLDLGADRLMVLADDIPPDLDEGAGGRFTTLAEAHAWLVEMLANRLELRPEQLVFVPTEYHGAGGTYLARLGRSLPPEVDLCWTGPEICSPAISAADAAGIGSVLRRPALVWDNYPVNDATMLDELHIGPIRGRDPDLGDHVRGFLVNAALQPEATLIPLATWAEYLARPESYDADAAWDRAVEAVAGASAAEVAVVAAALDRSVIEQGWLRPSTDELGAAVAALDSMANRRLAQDLAPFLAGRPR